jgi:tetratricopeptide (TPR) repeat protein
MSFGIRTLVSALSLLAILPTSGVSAESRWIKARLGSFEAISDDGRRSATQALSQFEQFSFALGTVMGQPDLRLDPPLRIIVFKNAAELQAQCPPALAVGRDRLMACATSEGQLPPELLRELTRTLLENNFAKMPTPIEIALETFFSTVQSTAVRVTWGAPPPQAERTREWALLHRVITQSDYAGKARIYLHNLTAGMDKGAASRNAFGEEGTKFEADVDAYYAAGVFNTSVAPNRPLNPERDFSTTFLTSDEGELMRADLLTPASAAIYQSLLKAGKQIAEANEGLAVLAMKDRDLAKARPYMEAARKAGTRNFVALTTYAAVQDDPARAIEILKEALGIDPKYAPAHWIFGEKLSDPARRLAEWKQAVNLAPRNHEWWARYAQLCVDQKQYAEAGRAWMAAAQAAPDVQLREQYLTARGQIEQQRLDAEDEERHREFLAKELEIDRLKNDARKELADLEARVNTRPLSAQEAARTVDFDEAFASEKLTGSLVRVECAGKQLRLSVKNDEGQTVTLLVPDHQQFEIKGGETLICGVQKPRRVTVSYKPTAKTPKQDAAKAIAGEAVGIEFQ